jgi:hypothetical protein
VEQVRAEGKGRHHGEYRQRRAAELARVLCGLERFSEADQFVEISRAATAPGDLASLMG